jgi:hypothetical protein
MIKTKVPRRCPSASPDYPLSIPEPILRRRHILASPNHQIYGFYEKVYLIFGAMQKDLLKFETLLRFEVPHTSEIVGEYHLS